MIQDPRNDRLCGELRIPKSRISTDLDASAIKGPEMISLKESQIPRRTDVIYSH